MSEFLRRSALRRVFEGGKRRYERAMRFLFVMDPVDTILVDEDTSFAIMLEGQTRGHRIDHCLVRDVQLRGGTPFASSRSATMSREAEEAVVLGELENVDIADYDGVFIRKDPPFDDEYLWLSLILERARGESLIINDPRGLRDANEKLYACHFPELMPTTLVSSSRDAIRAFTKELGGKAVIKPVDGHGGAGIFMLQSDDKNFNACVEAVTHGGKRVAMIQEFLPGVSKGDKRILLAGGEILGAILRVPKGDDLRSNIHVGGSVVATEIDADDQRIVDGVRERLEKDGLFFVGLDVIGGKLTEVNVTSPTGIQQMTRLSGINCEEKVWLKIEERLA